jgi:hypothetical protein
MIESTRPSTAHVTAHVFSPQLLQELTVKNADLAQKVDSLTKENDQLSKDHVELKDLATKDLTTLETESHSLKVALAELTTDFSKKSCDAFLVRSHRPAQA